jgi:hypothetical protein
MTAKVVQWGLFGAFFAVLFALKWSLVLLIACIYAALSLADG